MEVLDGPVEVAAIGIVEAPVIKRNDPPPPLEAQPGEALEVPIGAGPRHAMQNHDDGGRISYATAAATVAATTATTGTAAAAAAAGEGHVRRGGRGGRGVPSPCPVEEQGLAVEPFENGACPVHGLVVEKVAVEYLRGEDGEE